MVNDLYELTEFEISNDAKASKKEINKAVSPSHYKNFFLEYEWLEVNSQIPTLKDPEKWIAAIELQIRKYLDRRGQKDNILQELMKSKFYLDYLIAYIKNDCKFIKINEVQEILKR